MLTEKIFNTVNGKELFEMDIEPIRYVVSNLISQGLHIIAGSPKTGKSWLVLWLCLQVAKGENVWNFKTLQGTTLYLCLEDSLNRIQNRLYDITNDVPDNIHFAVMAENVASGLTEQIKNFVRKHSDTKLIVIDTLQKVRGSSKDNNQYANDYNDLSILKSVADRLGIAILLVHHLRKSSDDDPLNMISGTNGIAGAVDSSFVLKREKRTNSAATLYCTGRDIESTELHIKFDNETFIWNLISQENNFKNTDEIVKIIYDFLSPCGFEGTATELAEEIKTATCKEFLPNVLAKKLNRYSDELFELGIKYSFSRNRDKRNISLALCDGNDSNDDKNEIGSV